MKPISIRFNVQELYTALDKMERANSHREVSWRWSYRNSLLLRKPVGRRRSDMQLLDVSTPSISSLEPVNSLAWATITVAFVLSTNGMLQ